MRCIFILFSPFSPTSSHHSTNCVLTEALSLHLSFSPRMCSCNRKTLLNILKRKQNAQNSQQWQWIPEMKRNPGTWGKRIGPQPHLPPKNRAFLGLISVEIYWYYFLNKMNAVSSRLDSGGAPKREERQTVANFQKEKSKEIQALQEEWYYQKTELQAQV